MNYDFSVSGLKINLIPNMLFMFFYCDYMQ